MHVDQSSSVRKFERIGIFDGNVLHDFDEFCKSTSPDGWNEIVNFFTGGSFARRRYTERDAGRQRAQHGFGGRKNREFDINDGKQGNSIATQDGN
mmetsp:Transcript_31838/g.63432  ORF Transcript_31838/g.63432 Transcript_31838/m.63432 type:complete len:95 (-) Transcript_31838:1359-1643(-)